MIGCDCKAIGPLSGRKPWGEPLGMFSLGLNANATYAGDPEKSGDYQTLETRARGLATLPWGGLSLTHI